MTPEDHAKFGADGERILADFGKALQQAMEPVRREFIRLSERYPKPCDICGANLAGRTREQRQAHRQDHHWIRRAWHWWVTAWADFWKDFR